MPLNSKPKNGLKPDIGKSKQDSNDGDQIYSKDELKTPDKE